MNMAYSVNAKYEKYKLEQVNIIYKILEKK